jgi:hypothetical protein
LGHPIISADRGETTGTAALFMPLSLGQRIALAGDVV